MARSRLTAAIIVAAMISTVRPKRNVAFGSGARGGSAIRGLAWGGGVCDALTQRWAAR